MVLLCYSIACCHHADTQDTVVMIMLKRFEFCENFKFLKVAYIS